MSEDVVLTSGSSAKIYGTYDDAVEHIDMGAGDQYEAFRLADADGRKRALTTAARYIDRRIWVEAANTFEKRDAIAAFVEASYELAAIAAEDPGVLAVTNNGSNIKTAYSSGSGVEYWAPTNTKDGSAPLLPDLVEQLIGEYLLGGDVVIVGAIGESGACASEGAFSDCSDYDRDKPF